MVHVDGGIHGDAYFCGRIDNNFGEEGAKALGPHLAKLVNMQLLLLDGTTLCFYVLKHGCGTHLSHMVGRRQPYA